MLLYSNMNGTGAVMFAPVNAVQKRRAGTPDLHQLVQILVLDLIQGHVVTIYGGITEKANRIFVTTRHYLYAVKNYTLPSSEKL